MQRISACPSPLVWLCTENASDPIIRRREAGIAGNKRRCKTEFPGSHHACVFRNEDPCKTDYATVNPVRVARLSSPLRWKSWRRLPVRMSMTVPGLCPNCGSRDASVSVPFTTPDQISGGLEPGALFGCSHMRRRICFQWGDAAYARQGLLPRGGWAKVRDNELVKGMHSRIQSRLSFNDAGTRRRDGR